MLHANFSATQAALTGGSLFAILMLLSFCFLAKAVRHPSDAQPTAPKISPEEYEALNATVKAAIGSPLLLALAFLTAGLKSVKKGVNKNGDDGA
jgi:hypothetical protein